MGDWNHLSRKLGETAEERRRQREAMLGAPGPQPDAGGTAQPRAGTAQRRPPAIGAGIMAPLPPDIVRTGSQAVSAAAQAGQRQRRRARSGGLQLGRRTPARNPGASLVPLSLLGMG